MAFVVARGEVAPLELIEWAAARTAPYKRLAEVTFVDALPRSPAGKLLRRLLVERCNGAAAPRVNAPDVIRL
jgi:acyl-CoA synthetase (AMP-forming)/AMP-acid ligase II